MQVSELKEKARTVIDSAGDKRAVLLDYAVWSELLEELEDMEAIDEARESGDELIPSEQALKELGLSEDGPTRPFGLCAGEFVVPDDFDDPLPDDVLDAFEGRRINAGVG